MALAWDYAREQVAKAQRKQLLRVTLNHIEEIHVEVFKEVIKDHKESGFVYYFNECLCKLHSCNS